MWWWNLCCLLPVGSYVLVDLVGCRNPQIEFSSSGSCSSCGGLAKAKALAWARARPCQRFRKSMFQTVKMHGACLRISFRWEKVHSARQKLASLTAMWCNIRKFTGRAKHVGSVSFYVRTLFSVCFWCLGALNKIMACDGGIYVVCFQSADMSSAI